MTVKSFVNNLQKFQPFTINKGAKDDWNFQISDLVKNPDGTSYLTPAVNFSEVRRAQLAKSTLLTSTLVPLGSFQIL